MDVNVFYFRGNLGINFERDGGFSIASVGLGVVDTLFHFPKIFKPISENNIFNPNLYIGFGVLNANASIEKGIDCSVELVSGTVGIQLGDSISISAKGFVGFGFTLDFTDGISFGGGNILGYEISIDIDWYELFH